jgi:phage terminase small subunit
MARGELTINQEKFCQEYILTGNASEAYRRAYPKSLKWKEGIVNQKASRMLSDGKVSARVEELRGEVKAKFDISAERLLQEQARLALFDFRNIFDDNGKLIDPRHFPDDVAAAVSSIKISRQRSIDSQEAVEEVVELKLWNKNTALDSLFKNKGLYDQDNKQKQTDLAALISALQGKGLRI